MKGEADLKKSIKVILALVVIGAIIGLVIAYFCKTKGDCDCWEEDDEFDDEDFDLDDDLKPASEREYVHLHKTASEEVAEAAETVAQEAEAAEAAVADVVETAKAAVTSEE